MPNREQTVIFSMVSLFIASTAWAGTAASLPSAPSFAAAVEDALQVKRTDADVLTPLAAVVAAYSKDPDSAGEPLGRLVTALLAGPDPDVLTDKVLATVKLELGTGGQDSPDWKWGNYSMRLDIAGFMWKVAKDAQTTDPEKAQKIGRAAVMFAALNDYQQGWLLVPRVVKDKKEFQQITGLDDAAFAKLAAIVQARQKRHLLRTHDYVNGLRSIDAITATPAPSISKDKILEALAYFDEAFRKGPAQDGDRWLLILHTWQALNLARARGSKACQDLVRGQLESWKRDFSDDKVVSRWIDQALKLKGEPPPQMVHDYKMDPAGKMVEIPELPSPPKK